MATFETPEPIAVSVELVTGDIRIAASDRNDTIVGVRPSDAARGADVTAAVQTTVDCAGGNLLVRAPRRWLRYTPLGWRRGSVDVEISLPAGSSLRVDASLAAIRCAGSLGQCELRTREGEIMLDATGPLRARTGGGDITVERARGRVEARTASGTIRIGAVAGPGVIRNSTGDTWVGEATGGLRVSSASGKVSVDRAHSDVAAKTAYGDIHLGEVAHGAIVAETRWGRVDVGVRTGVAAWLDLQTQSGTVLNDLEGAGPPQPGEDTVEVRARTPHGDITVRRS
ncbi:MAG TPA: DUF4097 family beta strand repeat-containing protein [Candidatus Binatia bacterium]|nr:DUF4097 family beta strand repeat-containing protein [Candidatus Binatia bacterium]